MSKVYLLGSLNMDLVIESPYVPIAGETITGHGFMVNPGGKGANQAVAVASLGGEVLMLGAIGDDSYGEIMKENLKRRGVNTGAIKVCKQESSGIAIIIVCEGDNRIILNKGANSNITYKDVDGFFSTVQSGDIFLTQLENDIDVVGYALKEAKRRNMYTILNPAPANNDIKDYLSYVDLIIPNKNESFLLTGEKEYKRAAEKLKVPEVIITLGGDGYYYTNNISAIKGNCINVSIVDTTAAGDTFCGALAAQLSNGVCIEEAMEFAAKSASLTCTKKGAQQAIPTYKEVKEYNNR